MAWISISAVVSAAEPIDDDDSSSWLNITQDDIDPRFETVTSDFLATLVATVSSGGDPYSLLTHNCPVTRRITADGVVASYRARVIVNRSASLTGAYTLTAGNYEVIGQRQSTRLKSGDLLTDGRKIIELGWLPISLTVTQEYPPSPILTWSQDNGYLYLDHAEYAALYITGMAEVDIWEVLVEHQQGESFPDSSITVTAEWGVGNKVDAEIRIPGCVVDAFNECPKDSTVGGGVGGVDPDQKKWNEIQLNPSPPRTCYQDGCTGKIIRCDTMDDER